MTKEDTKDGRDFFPLYAKRQREILADLIKKNDAGKIRLNALREFKERTGLKGKELKEGFEAYWDDEKNEPKKTVKEPRQSKLKRKTLEGKESTVMKAISKTRMEYDKPVIYTDMNVKEGLSPKDKKALKASILKALDIHIKGSGATASRMIGNLIPRRIANREATYADLVRHLEIMENVIENINIQRNMDPNSERFSDIYDMMINNAMQEIDNTRAELEQYTPPETPVHSQNDEETNQEASQQGTNIKRIRRLRKGKGLYA